MEKKYKWKKKVQKQTKYTQQLSVWCHFKPVEMMNYLTNSVDITG